MTGYDAANDSMLDMYLFESSTLLEQLDNILLHSEKEENLSSDNINEIFRIMHTIKGSSAMMEFDIVSLVSHKLEDLFYIIRERGVVSEYFNELFDLVLKVSDFLKEEVEKIQQNQPLSTENESLISEITKLLDKFNQTEDNSNENNPNKIESEDINNDNETWNDGQPVFNLHIKFNADCQMENIRALMLVSKLESIGSVTSTVPEDLNDKDAANIISENGFYCSFATELSKEEIEGSIKGTLSVDKVSFIDTLPTDNANKQSSATHIDAEQKNPEASALSTASSDSKVKTKVNKQNLISVDLNKLDALMDLVGEIVITESMVSGNADLAGLELENFNKAARQLRKLTDELQDIVMSIRMIPIYSTFQKMQRIVRDMGKKLSKEVDLFLIGESTEVDKTIIDGIADPLMHVVRNAMDHAIEDRDTRTAANKDPVGKIILSAQNVGSDIIISISDDGKGLDAKQILEKAKEKNLLTKTENEYTEKEIFNLLTVPGFSTKDAVTEFSGRGVGMDVVKKNIEKIGGTVTIESVKGIGTNIFFKIPLTLAIISSMEIMVGQNIYAVPINNIRESFKASDHQLFSDPDNNEMIMIRGVCYPIIRLHKIFHLEGCLTNIEEGILLLVDAGDRLACLFADQLIGKHQVVVKPLPAYLSGYGAKASGIAGCTILGDGSISLILDVQGILKQH